MKMKLTELVEKFAKWLNAKKANGTPIVYLNGTNLRQQTEIIEEMKRVVSESKFECLVLHGSRQCRAHNAVTKRSLFFFYENGDVTLEKQKKALPPCIRKKASVFSVVFLMSSAAEYGKPYETLNKLHSADYTSHKFAFLTSEEKRLLLQYNRKGIVNCRLTASNMQTLTRLNNRGLIYIKNTRQIGINIDPRKFKSALMAKSMR